MPSAMLNFTLVAVVVTFIETGAGCFSPLRTEVVIRDLLLLRLLVASYSLTLSLVLELNEPLLGHRRL